MVVLVAAVVPVLSELVVCVNVVILAITFTIVFPSLIIAIVSVSAIRNVVPINRLLTRAQELLGPRGLALIEQHHSSVRAPLHRKHIPLPRSPYKPAQNLCAQPRARVPRVVAYDGTIPVLDAVVARAEGGVFHAREIGIDTFPGGEDPGGV